MNSQPESNTRLRGRWFAWSMLRRPWLALAHAAWLVCAALALLIFLAAIPLGYVQRSSDAFGVPIDAPAWYVAGTSLVHMVVSMLTALVCLVLAAIFVWKRRAEPMALFVSFFLLAYGIVLAGPLEALNGFRLILPGIALQGGMVISADTILEIQSALFVVLGLLFYLFPNGRFIPCWTRYAALLVLLLAPAFIRVLSVDWPSTMTPFAWLIFSVYSVLLAAGIYAQIYRYRRVATPLERQQTKWVVFGLVLTLVIMTILQIPYAIITSIPMGIAHPWWQPLTGLGWRLSLTILPLSLAVAVMRYRLWDIDIFINRSLVYGALTASVLGLYVSIVGGLGLVLQTQNNLPGIVVAILLIAFLFQPLRRRLQDIANHFVPVPLSTAQSQSEDEATIPERMADTKFHGHWLLIARLTWIVLAILNVGLFIVAIPGYASEISEYVRASRNTIAAVWDIVFYVSGSVASIVSALLSFILALIIIWRKPSERMAVFVSCYLLLFGAILGGSLERTVVLWPEWEIRASAIAKPLLFATPTIGLLALFPSGKFVPHWTRWLTLGSILLIPAIFYLPPWWWPDVSSPLARMTAIAWTIILFAALYAQIHRYRRVSNSTERQQTKWAVFGFFLWVLLVSVVSGPYAVSYGSSPLSPHSWWAPVVRAVWFLSSTILPISLTIAVVRYRLFDIDLLINRGVVYLTMTAIVVGIYVFIVGYLGTLFRAGNNLAVSLIATGLVAMVFQPLRQRLQRGINHLMYGERDEPYAALSRLGRRLESTLAPEAVLPTVVTTVREALKLPYTAIYLKQDDNSNKIVAESASPSLRAEGERIRVPGMEHEGLCIPLIHQGETLGYLVLGPRAPNEAFNSTDLRLLDDLAPQVGVAVHAARLTADLQRSREQLVLAREEERRRLRRDLHDGLGPQLAGLALKLETLRNRLKDDPLADSLLADLAKRTQDATADIRHLVYALRPIALDELGLVSALREGVMQYTQQGCGSLNITFDAPESLPLLPAAVEVAVYRIAQEALMNVVRHAEARTCHVRLRLDESADLLCLEVHDDGRGLPMKRRAGVGLNSMRERAEELGGTLTITSILTGGTLLTVRLPCRMNDRNTRDVSQEES